MTGRGARGPLAPTCEPWIFHLLRGNSKASCLPFSVLRIKSDNVYENVLERRKSFARISNCFYSKR